MCNKPARLITIYCWNNSAAIPVTRLSKTRPDDQPNLALTLNGPGRESAFLTVLWAEQGNMPPGLLVWEPWVMSTDSAI